MRIKDMVKELAECRSKDISLYTLIPSLKRTELQTNKRSMNNRGQNELYKVSNK